MDANVIDANVITTTAQTIQSNNMVGSLFSFLQSFISKLGFQTIVFLVAMLVLNHFLGNYFKGPMGLLLNMGLALVVVFGLTFYGVLK